jgi:hypothetical protein
MKKKIPKHPNKSGSFKNTSDSPKSGLLIAGALLLLTGLALLFLIVLKVRLEKLYFFDPQSEEAIS